MTPERLLGEELARPFQDDVHAQVSPGYLAGSGVRRIGQPLVAERDRMLPVRPDFCPPAALDRVELDQVARAAASPFTSFR